MTNIDRYDSLSDSEKKKVNALLHELNILDSRESLLKFTQSTFNKFEPEWFHKTFYDVLNRFALRDIGKLIISMPPQHGKSEGSTRRLPAYLAGIRPDDKIAVVSYSATKAQKFGREIMNIMKEPSYVNIFPNVKYPDRGYTGQKSNTNLERESVNSEGSMKFVGVDGPLTGDSVDVLILDDLYKGWKDANSPVTQQSVFDWYSSVAETRLHNDSQQLITFTRWSDSDLIAKLIDLGLVVVYDGSIDLDTVIKGLKDNQYLLINFQGLKEGEPTEFDPRESGEALWDNKHSRRKLEGTRQKDPDKFDCLYQGNPQNKDGMLYVKPFKTYDSLPKFKEIKNYTDTADSGDNYLCSICYGVPLSDSDPHYYILDWVYSDKGMEVTEGLTVDLLEDNKVNKAWVESNNGGKGFARNVKSRVDKTINIQWFHQGDNKESRVFSNSATVNNCIVFPSDWHVRDPIFYKHLTKFKKMFKANKVDDIPDVLTGIIEIETKTETLHSPKTDIKSLGLL